MLTQENVMVTQLQAAVKKKLRDADEYIGYDMVDAGNDIKNTAKDVGDVLWDRKPSVSMKKRKTRRLIN